VFSRTEKNTQKIPIFTSISPCSPTFTPLFRAIVFWLKTTNETKKKRRNRQCDSFFMTFLYFRGSKKKSCVKTKHNRKISKNFVDSKRHSMTKKISHSLQKEIAVPKTEKDYMENCQEISAGRV
jgi:hypothetical protein